MTYQAVLTYSTYTHPTVILPVGMGEVSFYDNSSATTISTADTWTKVAVTSASLTMDKFFDMSSTGRLRYTGTPTVSAHCGCTIAIQSTGNSDVVKAVLYKNGTVNGSNEYTAGTALTQGQISTKTASAGDVISSAIHVMTELATNDYIELAIKNVTDTDNLTVVDMNIFALAIL